MPKRIEWIERMSRTAVCLAIVFVLSGFRVWGNDYSHANSIVAQATADKDRAIIAAIEASRSDAIQREQQTQAAIGKLIEVNRMLLERIDDLTGRIERGGE